MLLSFCFSISGATKSSSKLHRTTGILYVRSKLSPTRLHRTPRRLDIQRLEIAKNDLQHRIAKEARGNAILQASLERRKQALHERCMALEQDVILTMISIYLRGKVWMEVSGSLTLDGVSRSHFLVMADFAKGNRYFGGRL
ncbi:rho GTPase-activating protein 6-like isoform X2 [Alnus glutinosa]|uniref:rho GTPase-activating protein 6-like isoform X2 n=1 Tax=Alnus glutinosa TaxID=3517 RepID=UPI002D78F1AC|nr:rho GTPase-activating protein 6-like isoform X2 [Alnus glutinosa]